jgi:hypothetical protein
LQRSLFIQLKDVVGLRSEKCFKLAELQAHSLPILDPIAAKGAPAGHPLSFRWHAENSPLQACHNTIPHHLIGRLFLTI